MTMTDRPSPGVGDQQAAHNKQGVAPVAKLQCVVAPVLPEWST